MLSIILYWWELVENIHIHTHTGAHSKGNEMVKEDESYHMLPIGSWEMFPAQCI